MSKANYISTLKRIEAVHGRSVYNLLLVVLLMLLSSHLSTAQIKTSIKYSADIEHRINTAKQIAQQVKQFRKDSSKLVKEKYNQLKHTTDSLVKHRKQQLSPDKLTSNSQELQELTSVQQQAGALVDQKYTQVGKYKKISKKELQTMVMQNLENRPELEAYKAMIDRELLPYRPAYEQYKYLPQLADSLKQQAKSINLDSAELWQELDRFAESEAMKTNYYEAFMKEQGNLAKLQSNPQTGMQSDVPSFDFENHPLKTARQAGMKHFDKLGKSIEQGKEQLDKLKKKYASVPDANDLKTARKKNSLSDVPAKKRIVYGGNLHLDIGDPLYLDFNPILGYRLNRNWMAGIGGTARFRLSYTDSTDFEYKVPTTGARAFGEYRFYKSFLAHGEYEVLVDNLFTKETQQNIKQATQSINIGLGSTFGIYKGFKGKALLLYNITLDGESKYHSPWVVRFGFLN